MFKTWICKTCDKVVYFSKCPYCRGECETRPIFNADEMDWLVANAEQIKNIIGEKGRVSLDMKCQIELWTRRTNRMKAKIA